MEHRAAGRESLEDLKRMSAPFQKNNVSLPAPKRNVPIVWRVATAFIIESPNLLVYLQLLSDRCDRREPS